MRTVIILTMIACVLVLPLQADDMTEVKNDAAGFADTDPYRNTWGFTGLISSLIVSTSAYFGLSGYNPEVMMYLAAITLGIGTFILTRTAFQQPEIEMSDKSDYYKKHIRKEIDKQVIRNRIIYLVSGVAVGAASLLILNALPLDKQ